ncbi:MAG: FtsW/RodA/SpoVE family cell cycle protein, partial [Clostridiales bacterium]|nr:FtsW/RodA/SpoVE family cell cycle protein [Clostridiales bacterium]
MSEYESKAQIEELISSKTFHGREGVVKKHVNRANIPLFIMLMVIVCLGLVILYSVSSPIGYAERQDSLFYVKKQITFTLIGMGAILLLHFIDPIWLFRRKYLLLCVSSGGLALLLAVITLVAGRQYNGARRWFMIGGFQFQPSEMVKVLLVVSFAAYRQFIVNLRKEGKLKAKSKRGQVIMDTMFDFIVPIVGAVVVDLFILLEPHGSCAMIIAAVIFVCALSSGINHRSWAVGIAIMLGVAIVFGA